MHTYSLAENKKTAYSQLAAYSAIKLRIQAPFKAQAVGLGHTSRGLQGGSYKPIRTDRPMNETLTNF